jgi:hypothetical protein
MQTLALTSLLAIVTTASALQPITVETWKGDCSFSEFVIKTEYSAPYEYAYSYGIHCARVTGGSLGVGGQCLFFGDERCTYTLGGTGIEGVFQSSKEIKCWKCAYSS